MKDFKMSRVNVYTILRDLVFNFWVIVLAVITGFVGSICYYNYIHKNTYVSSMTVSINLNGYTTEATALSLARTVVIAETLDDVFQSKALMDVVRKDIGDNITGTISAKQLGETNLVRISVSDISPEKAYEMLVSVYNNYDKVTDYVFNNVIIRTVANPTMPTAPSGGISVRTTSILWALIAGVIVTAIIVLISFMRDTVKNVSDVENELNTKLFGTVCHVKKMGHNLPASKRKLVVTNPLVGFSFANSFRKIAVKLEILRRTKGINALMVTSVAENEGKTSCSVNIAISLAQNGYNVLLLDCDLKKPAVHYFFDGVENAEHTEFNMYLESGGDIEQFIKHDPATGVFVLDNIKPCTDSAEKLSDAVFADALRMLKERFDFIIIDTPPCGIAVDAEAVSNVADAVLLVVRQDVATVTDINDQIENLSRCYMAGCIFNDIAEFGMRPDVLDEYNSYYSRQNG